jgi:hypothetical protein
MHMQLRRAKHLAVTPAYPKGDSRKKTERGEAERTLLPLRTNARHLKLMVYSYMALDPNKQPKIRSNPSSYGDDFPSFVACLLDKSPYRI